MLLDGKRLGDYGPQLAQLSVPPGRHTVRFESPYCFPKDVDIDDGEPAGRLAARLRWKPARLTVRDRSRVGRRARRRQHPALGPARSTSRFPSSSDGKKSVSVKVAAPGFVSQTLAVELRANDQHVQSVVLRQA